MEIGHTIKYEASNQFLKFCLKTNKWEKKAEMLVGLSGHFAGAYQKELVIGYGWKSGRFTNSIWKYKIETNEWFKLKRFSEKRDSCAFFSFENSLLIFGGYENKRSNDFLVFKFAVGDWSLSKHCQFPLFARRVVFLLLLFQKFKVSFFSFLPKVIIFEILKFSVCLDK